MTAYITILIICAIAVSFPFMRGVMRKQAIAAKIDLPESRNQTATKQLSPTSKMSAAPKSKPARSSFRAASVHGLPDCCQAAKDLEAKRFLLDELPSLPLEACDRLADCQCSFTQHSDRRNTDERRGERKAFAKSAADGDADTNRRSGLDRRSELNEELQDIEFE
jgi:hypothetical protein